MTGSPELLEFYLVEAMEYVDALDRLVTGQHAPPDASAVLATARALRGSSSMAKVQPIAEISLALEQIANRCRDGEQRWDDALYHAMRSTIDDLRLLVRDVRVWGDREQGRADACRTRLRPFLPSSVTRPPTPAAGSTIPVFVALQSAAIAAELDAFVDHPGNRRSLDDALARSRTLRGIAGIGDHPPLGDVAEVVERVGRKLVPDAPPSPDEHELFRAAANLMRRAAEQLRAAGRHEPDQADLARFARAVSALESPAPLDVPVVRIDQLFYLDEGPHVVRRGDGPTKTPAQRFSAELVTRGEHLRHLVNERRQALDLVVQERTMRELRRALHELAALAEGYRATRVATYCTRAAADDRLGAPERLEEVERVAALMAAPLSAVDEFDTRVAAFLSTRAVTPKVSPRLAPTPLPTRPTLTAVGAKGGELKELLNSGLAGLGALEAEVLDSAGADEDVVVPVESLLYRGSAALARAIEVRDGMRERGEADPDGVQEIFDLLDLALAE